MALDYPVFPSDILPITVDTTLIQPTFGFESNFTGSSQDVIHPGARWQFTKSFNTLDLQKSRRLSVFLNDLQGRAGWCKVVDESRPGQPANGTPYVSGPNQTGRSVTSLGWRPNVRALSVGDFITINGELKEVREDVWTDAVGLAEIRFNPPLRRSPQNSEPIITEDPYMIAKLDMDNFTLTNGPMRLSKVVDLVFTEVIYRV